MEAMLESLCGTIEVLIGMKARGLHLEGSKVRKGNLVLHSSILRSSTCKVIDNKI